MPGYFFDKHWFIALAAIRHRCQKGGVSFDQQAFQRDFFGRIADGLSLGKGNVASEGNHEAQIECPFSVRPGAGEAVQNSSQTAGLPPGAITPGMTVSVFWNSIGRPAVD